MGFALPLAVVFFVAAMPHAPKTQEDPEAHSPDKKGPIVRKGKAASSQQAGIAVLQRLLRQSQILSASN
jgi:hypothetical protein